MTARRTDLPKRVTQGYWKKVGQLLRSRYRLSVECDPCLSGGTGAGRGGDEIYHAPVEETAKGIVRGGYASDGLVQSPKPTSSVKGTAGLTRRAAKRAIGRSA